MYGAGQIAFSSTQPTDSTLLHAAGWFRYGTRVYVGQLHRPTDSYRDTIASTIESLWLDVVPFFSPEESEVEKTRFRWLWISAFIVVRDQWRARERKREKGIIDNGTIERGKVRGHEQKNQTSAIRSRDGREVISLTVDTGSISLEFPSSPAAPERSDRKVCPAAPVRSDVAAD